MKLIPAAHNVASVYWKKIVEYVNFTFYFLQNTAAKSLLKKPQFYLAFPMGSSLSVGGGPSSGDMTVTADDEEVLDRTDRSTATGLPTVMTSISESGDGGDSNVGIWLVCCCW
jgi:hypothetical protein